MYTALPERRRNVTTLSTVPITNTASQPRLRLTSPVGLFSATSRCTLSVSPGLYKFTMAASALVCVNSDSRRAFTRCGNGGGGVSGYRLFVQSY
jgi:hypothetical protein